MRATDLATPTWDRVAPGEPEDYWQADLTDAGAARALVGRLRRRRPHRRDPAADPQPASRRLREQHAEHVQRARGGDRGRRPPVRELLERDGAGVHLRVSRLQARLPPDRRGASRQAAGSVRDREVVRRAAVRPGGRAGGHPLHVDPPVLGPGRGQLRAEPRPDRSRPGGPDRQLLLVRRRVRPLRRRRPRDRDATFPGTRSSTSPRRTPSAGIRSWRRSRATTTARGSSSGPVPREDASSISTAKAERMLGWAPKRSWRDYLDDEGRARA